MSIVVKVPSLGANEEFVTFIEWLRNNGDYVRRGDPICTVETTKAVYDIEAETDGYLVWIADSGQRIAVGAPVAVLKSTSDEDISKVLASTHVEPELAKERRWTKKAELVAKRLGVDLEKLAQRNTGKLLGEADVVAAAQAAVGAADLLDDKYPDSRQERVLLIGGGAGGGVITLDALSRVQRQRAVGIVDNNSNVQGKTMMGVPILGPINLVEELWEKKAFDAAIIVITANISERADIFETLRSKGIRFTNVIDPTVSIRSHVSMGQGNLIMGNSFLAACVSIGDNNFLASHTCIEHHSKIGSHCTFGPRSTLSGAVIIEDRVKLGMGVLIEPYITVGRDSLIPSGSMVTSDIPANSVLKKQDTQTIRERSSS